MDIKLNTYTDTLQSIEDIHAPVKFPKICSRPCLFVNQEIKDLMKCRDGLKWFLQTQDAIDWANFKESYNLVKKTLLEAERNHTFKEVKLHQKIHGSLWKIINHALLLKIKERQIYSKDLTSTANEFNQFFRSCWKNATGASLHLAKENNIGIPKEISVDLPPINEPFNLRTVTCEEVRQVALSLPLNKAHDPDKVSAHIIKDCMPTHHLRPSCWDHSYQYITKWVERSRGDTYF